MKFLKTLASWALAWGSIVPNLGAAVDVYEKDLSIVLHGKSYLKIDTTSVLSSGELLFPDQWYDEILASFRASPIGEAIERENRFSQWQIVALRVDPCSSLTYTTRDAFDYFCWPELRVVWQPVVENLRRNHEFFTHYADDRAIHMIYPLSVAHLSSTDQPQRLAAIKDRIEQLRDTHIRLSYSQLHSDDQVFFQKARDRLSQILLKDTKALRNDREDPQVYRGFGFRPETYHEESYRAFLGRLRHFLSKYARPGDLQRLTSFSLPAGRAPGEINFWGFVDFAALGGRLRPQPTIVRSLYDGRPILNLGHFSGGRIQQDDQRIYGMRFPKADLDALQASLMLTPGPQEEVARRNLLSPHQVQVVNSSCASCHRINPNRANFHLLSGFEGQMTQVSARVQAEVAENLFWVRQIMSNPE